MQFSLFTVPSYMFYLQGWVKCFCCAPYQTVNTALAFSTHCQYLSLLRSCCSAVDAQSVLQYSVMMCRPTVRLFLVYIFVIISCLAVLGMKQHSHKCSQQQQLVDTIFHYIPRIYQWSSGEFPSSLFQMLTEAGKSRKWIKSIWSSTCSKIVCQSESR